MGAWIETDTVNGDVGEHLSHPTWVRGLKHNVLSKLKTAKVAPYVGAWIETALRVIPHDRYTSHPTWVRGLKQK